MLHGWTTRAYVVKAEPQTITPVIIQQKLTVVMLDGIWRKAGEVQRFWSDSLQPGLDLDYPHDYEHDYKPTTRNATAHNPQPTAMPFQMTIFGPATAPAITIGGNRYKLTTDIPSGCFCDHRRHRRPQKRHTDGRERRRHRHFRQGRTRRRTGRRKLHPSNPYRPATAPSNGGDSGFDLTVFEEESEPPWT